MLGIDQGEFDQLDIGANIYLLFLSSRLCLFIVNGLVRVRGNERRVDKVGE